MYHLVLVFSNDGYHEVRLIHSQYLRPQVVFGEKLQILLFADQNESNLLSAVKRFAKEHPELRSLLEYADKALRDELL